MANGHLRGQSDTSRLSQMSSAPFFPEVDGLLSLFKDACKELVDLRKQVTCLGSTSTTIPCFFLSLHRYDISKVFVKYFGRLMEGSTH